MGKIRLLLEELKSFYTFYFNYDKSEREIVIYAEDTASYRYFEGLINNLTVTRNQKICYITSDIDDPIFRKNSTNINVLYIESLLPFFTLTLNSKLLIMTAPDLNQCRIRRSELGAHHVYIFHNIGSSFPVIRYGAIFNYDTIFCVGPHHKEEIQVQEDIYNLQKKNLLEFGYYSLEKVYKVYKNYDHSKKVPTAYKARILLAPSWGVNSTLDVCGSELIRILLNCNYEVILRPHPMTKKESPQLLDSLNREFGNFDNYVYEGDISSTESFYNSDLMISDWSGVAYEYAFGTERPVLFINVPQKIVNQRYKEVGIEPIDIGIRKRIGAVLNPDELDKADSIITDMISKKDSCKQEIIKARSEFVYNFGSSSRAGANFLINFLDNINEKKAR